MEHEADYSGWWIGPQSTSSPNPRMVWKRRWIYHDVMKRCQQKHWLNDIEWPFWSFQCVVICRKKSSSEPKKWWSFAKALRLIQSFFLTAIGIPRHLLKMRPKRSEKYTHIFNENLWIWSLIIFDLCDQISKWPSQADLQASDRAHRIGQTRLNGWIFVIGIDSSWKVGGVSVKVSEIFHEFFVCVRLWLFGHRFPLSLCADIWRNLVIADPTLLIQASS